MKMCLWKTLAGAWTTSWRMHESHKFGCLFGCKEEHDDIRHYLVCAPLWHLTGEVLGSPPPVSLAERMCIDKPSVQGVLRLAVVFQAYHYTKSLVSGDSPQVNVQDTCALQRAAFESSRTFLCHLS